MESSAARALTDAQPLIRELTPRVGTPIPVGLVTAVVGPANSGKSELLRDLVRLTTGIEPDAPDHDARDHPQPRVLKDLTLVGKLTLDRILEGLVQIPMLQAKEDATFEVRGLGPDQRSAHRMVIGSDIKHVLQRPVITASAVRDTPLADLLKLRVSYVSASDRASLVAATNVANPLRNPDGLLQALHEAPPEIRQQLDEAFGEAFEGTHLRLDDKQRVELTLRVADKFPDEDDENALATALAWSQLPALHERGHSQVHFAAVVLSMLMSRGRIVVIDQPELALTPDVTRRLGFWMASHAADLRCQLFLLTHSHEFLQGLFAAAADVTIVRMDRYSDAPRMRVVPPSIGQSLASHPLFSSQHASDACLHEGVVLTRDSNDALLIQAISQRLGDAAQLRFLHAHGARQLSQMANVLRQAELNFSVVTGMDLFQWEKRFTQLVEAVTAEPPPQPWLATRDRLARFVEGKSESDNQLSSAAAEVESFLEQLKEGQPGSADVTPPPPVAISNWQRLVRDGLEFLPAELRLWVEELIEDLKQKGIFVALRGGMHQWFPPAPTDVDQVARFLTAVRHVQEGNVPADLRAFVQEILAFNQASRSLSRSTGTR